MDHEYIQHIKGSPYITEGKWDQWKSKAAQQLGSLGAQLGHQIQKDPNIPAVRSLWDGFMKSLKKRMKDWETQVSPMFTGQIELDERATQLKEALDALASALKSQTPQKMGNFHDTPDQYAGGRNYRDNPETYITGNPSFPNPSMKLKTIAPKTPVKEGLWDMATRDMELNKALGTNDPIQILNAYKKHILGLFTAFMKDATKATKLTAQQIYGLIAKMQPDDGGWQPAANMQRVVECLKALQQIGDLTSTNSASTSSATNTNGSGATPPPVPNTPYNGPVPPVIGQQQQQPTTAPQSGQSQSGPNISGGNVTVQPNEFPFIILKAIKIINDAVSSDTAHAGKYFDADKTGNFTSELPTQPHHPSLTKEGEEDDGQQDAEGGEEKDVEYPGEFIYNFRSRFRKFPGTNFSVQVKPVKETDDVDGLQNTKIEVWWNCENTVNKIYVVVVKNGNKSKPIPIMKFGDHQVNSQAGATTQGHVNFFSINNIMKMADKTSKNTLDDKLPPEKLSGASKEVMEAIKAQEPKLLRALMAVTARKAMEFKPKSKKVFPVTYNKQGDVTFTDKQGQQKTVTKAEVPALLNGDKGAEWIETLEHYDYFKEFPDMKPADPNNLPSYEDAQAGMMALGYGEGESRLLLMHSWMELKKTKDPASITPEEWIKAALKEKDKASTPKPAAAASTPAPTPAPKPSVSSAPTAPVSKPAGAPAPSAKPTAPVSAPVSGPAPTTTPTAPVSKPAPKPEASPEQEFGKLELDGNELVWTHPKSQEIHHIDASQLAAYIKKYPKLEKACKANPDLYKKFEASNGKKDNTEVDGGKKQEKPKSPKPKQKGGGGKSQVNERIINPFNSYNFL